MAGETPGIRRRGERFFVRHGDVSLGTAKSLNGARVMRDLYTIASGSTRVPLYFPADTYVTQIATVEDFDDDKRIALCSELIDAYKLLNGATLRPTIDGRRMSFAAEETP